MATPYRGPTLPRDQKSSAAWRVTPPSTAKFPAPEPIRVSEILAALSHALDLTEGQPRGHSLRCCLIGMRLGEEVGLGATDRSALYYALLLKDAGCSSNAARMSAIFGSDDRAIKPSMKLVDWHHRARLAVRTARNVGIGQPLAVRLQHFLAVARTPALTRELIQVRCERGADIARDLGFAEATAEAIRSLDEHWDGQGHPSGLRGTGIPLLARIGNLAQVVEVFHHDQGLRPALRMLRQRREHWFDPALVDAVLGWRRDRGWWESLGRSDIAGSVIATEPDARPHGVREPTLDQIAAAFAGIIDAKSPYTSTHSSNVARYACGIASAMGVGPSGVRRLHRAGLLHDIGKLGVSSRILDKAGPLTPEERRGVERHPVFTWEILSRVSAFDDFARTAALHHEKLDGSGYPWGVGADGLDQSSRILVVADIYEALTADRPYRAGMAPAKALGILRQDAGTRLCPRAIEGLDAHLELVESRRTRDDDEPTSTDPAYANQDRR